MQHYMQLSQNNPPNLLTLADMYLKGICRVVKDTGTSGDVSRWVLETIQFTKQKNIEDKFDPHRADMLLFRLLTIKYRATFPRKGPRVPLQEDVEALLDQ